MARIVYLQGIVLGNVVCPCSVYTIMPVHSMLTCPSDYSYGGRSQRSYAHGIVCAGVRRRMAAFARNRGGPHMFEHATTVPCDGPRSHDSALIKA